MISVEEVVNDFDFAQEFLIQRSEGGSWVNGVWETPYKTIPSYGTIEPAEAHEVEVVPEGDKGKELIVIWSSSPVYTTRAPSDQGDAAGQSRDIVCWQGRLYSVVASKKWNQFGYWRALAAREDAV